MIINDKVTPQEYAKIKGVSVATIYRKIGDLDTIKEGNKTYILISQKNENENNIDKKKEIKIEKNLINTIDSHIILNENQILKERLLAKDKEIELLNKNINELKKEKDELKYQVKNKDIEIRKLFEKMENLNEKVIGLIEWKSKPWWQKILKK